MIGTVTELGQWSILQLQLLAQRIWIKDKLTTKNT